MPIVKQLTIWTENLPGRLAEVAAALKEKNVDILGLWAGVAGERWVIRLIVDDIAAARQHLSEVACWDITEDEVLEVTVETGTNRLGDAARQLERAGLNIEYAYMSPASSSGRLSAYFAIVDLESAARALGELAAAA
jgi:hypothetical protein